MRAFYISRYDKSSTDGPADGWTSSNIFKDFIADVNSNWNHTVWSIHHAAHCISMVHTNRVLSLLYTKFSALEITRRNKLISNWVIFPWLISIPEFLEQDRAGLVFWYSTFLYCFVQSFLGSPKIIQPITVSPCLYSTDYLTS